MTISLVKTLSVAMILTLAGTVGASDKSGEKFRADLTGDAQVPDPLVTDTEGDFRLAYDDFEGTASYRIRLNDGSRVFMAHIHCGTAAQNGPIVVWLAGAPPAPHAWDVDGK